MNTDNFFQKLKIKLIEFWAWLSPYLAKFWRKLSSLWKKYHMTKISILTILTIALVLSTYLSFLARSADVESLQDGLEQTTTIVDASGEEAGSISQQKGSYVSLDQIDDQIEDAIISTEDKRFYSHHGFDPIGIARAAVGFVLNGEIVGGGSTLTQQLAKNAFLSADQTITRKLKELFLAIEIEKYYTKDEVLEMYLNNAYFGKGVWGVQDASLRYFGKPAQDVKIGEAATLAGMLTAPSSYNPVDNYEASINRRNTVLMLMEDNQVITPEQRSQVANADLQLSNAYNSSDSYQYPYYFDAVINEAINRYGFDEEELLNRGYTVYTSLNQNQQQAMNSVYQQNQLFAQAEDGTNAQSASVAMNPQTGGVAATVGGRGEYTIRGFNRATQMNRQPGSVIKPLGVYAPALEEGYEVDSMLQDEPTSYGETEYTPPNLSGEYQGEVPMYEAAAQSLNAPTVWLLNEIGIDTGAQKLEEFGINVSEKDAGELGAIALGGMNNGTSPLEIASAYSIFANNGVRVEPHFITKIVDASGNVVVNNTNPESTRVLSEEVNSDMNRLLLGVFSNGTAQANQPEGYTVAGKTGTTENANGNGVSNQWIAGYTPDLVVTSWMGYDETNDDHYLSEYASQGVGMVFKEQMESMLPYTSQTQFNVESIQPESGENNSNVLNQIESGLKGAAENIQRGAGELYDRATDLWDSFTN